MPIKSFVLKFNFKFRFTIAILIISQVISPGIFAQNDPFATAVAIQGKNHSIQIEMTVIPNKMDQAVEVTAAVSLPFDFDGDLDFKWKLGPEVHLVRGSLSGKSATNFTKHVAKEMKIWVDGYTPEKNRHIAFEVSGSKNGYRLFGNALIASQKEKSFEMKVQKIERSLKSSNRKLKKMEIIK